MIDEQTQDPYHRALDKIHFVWSNILLSDVDIIFGTSVDNTLGDEIRITVIAAGFDEQAPRPSVRQTTFAPAQVDPVAAEPVVEESLVQTNWFGAQTGAVPVVTDTVSIPEPTVVPDPVDSIQERRETSFFGRRQA